MPALLRDALGPQLVGTSNVHFARLYGMTRTAPWRMSTCRHSRHWARACGIRRWRRWNRGRANTVATSASRCPTVGLDAFLRDFDMYFCKLFDGVRHDSGDPFDWGDHAGALPAAPG